MFFRMGYVLITLVRCRGDGAEKSPPVADPEGSPHSHRMRA